MSNQLHAIKVQPGKQAEIVTITNNLASFQKHVEGYIEALYPFEDDNVAVIANEEGKIINLPLNRALYDYTDNSRDITDIIAGNFLIVYAPETSEKFESLPDSLQSKYLDRFLFPEVFIKDKTGTICVIKEK